MLPASFNTKSNKPVHFMFFYKNPGAPPGKSNKNTFDITLFTINYQLIQQLDMISEHGRFLKGHWMVSSADIGLLGRSNAGHHLMDTNNSLKDVKMLLAC